MSRFAVVPTAWLRDTTLTTYDKVVLCVIASYADTNGYCWPSVPTIAAGAGASERQVQYCLKHLQDVGAIDIVRRQRNNGDAASNGYWLKGYDRPVVNEVHHAGAVCAPGVVQEMHPNNTSKNKTTEHTTTTASVFVFERDEHQQVYESLRRGSRLPAAFDASLRTCLEPMTGGKAYTLDQLGAALLELAGNGESFNIGRLRGYLRRGEVQPLPAYTPGARRPQADMYAEAARLLGIAGGAA